MNTPVSVDLSTLFNDPDGDTLTYTVDNGTVSGTMLTFNPTSAGTTIINVTATDSYGDSDDTTVEIISSAGNVAPTLSLETNDVTVASGSTISLPCGSSDVVVTLVGHDVNGDTLTYSVLPTGLGTLSGNTYTFSPVAVGMTSVTFSVSDNKADPVSKTLTFDVGLAEPSGLAYFNTTPVSTTFAWNAVLGATGYEIAVVEGNDIGDMHNVTLTETFASATYSPDTSATSYSNRTINNGNLGTWTVTQCRSDNTGGPTIRADGTLTSPEISRSVSAVEFDYAWPYGDTDNVDIDLYADSTKVGTATITANQGTTGTATYSNLSIDGPTTLEFRNTATKDKRMQVTAVRIICPVNVVIEDTVASTSYTAEGLSPSKTYSFVVSAVATNEQGTVIATSAADTATVTTTANAAPTLSTNPSGTASVVGGHTLSVALTANDTDTGDTVTLSVSPDNLGTLTDNGNGTGSFSWTPAATASGTQSFRFTATDPYGAYATADLAVTVTPNQDPEIASDETISILEGDTVNATILADDNDGDAVTLELTSFDGPAPAPSFTDNGDGSWLFSWTAPEDSNGNYTARFTASDGFGGSATSNLTITVTAANANATPVVTVSPASVSVNVRDAVFAEVSATDANNDGVELAMTSATIPRSAFEAEDDYGVLSWTAPTAAGTYTASFTATDDADDPLTSEAVTFTVIVTNAAPEIILDDAALSCNAGGTVETTVMGSDLFAAPTLSVSGGGTLGTSSVSSEGNDRTAEASWSWTPNTPGTYIVTFTARDADDANLFATATLTVTVGLDAPSISVSGTPGATKATLASEGVTGADGYLVTYSGVTTNTATFFDEDFEKFDSTNKTLGNNTNPFDKYLNAAGWTGENCYMRATAIGEELGGTYALQIGSSSASGNFVSPPLNDVFPGSKLYLSCYVTAEDNGYIYFATMDATNGVRSWVRLGSASNPMDAGTTRAVDLESMSYDYGHDYGLTIQPGDRLVIEGQATAQANRLRIDNLKVWGTQTTVADAEKTVGVASFPATLTGLLSGTVYTATAVATNGASVSPASNAVRFETFGLKPPANLEFSGTTHKATTLSWDAVDGADSYSVSVAVPGATISVLEETFDSCEETPEQGNNEFNTANPTAMDNDDIEGWELQNAYSGVGCAKFGKSKEGGSATLPALGAAGDYTLSFRTAPWGTEENKTLQISVTGGGTLDISSVSLVKGQWTEYAVAITGATAATRITFSASNRFFLDDVVVTGQGAPTVVIDNAQVSASASPSYTATGLLPETTYTFTVTASATVDGDTVTSSASSDVKTTAAPPPPPPTALFVF